MKKFIVLAAIAALTGGILVVAPATPAHARSSIVIRDAFSRPANDMGAVFLNVVNTGPADDKLDRASTDVCDAAEVHETYSVDGGEGMRHIPFLAIPAGHTVALKSGSYHIMLIGLRHELRAGQRFVLRLHFADAGWIDVPVDVKDF